ncbi:hydantoin utilization protein A [Chromatiales bacterium (ex Bugula neritina AB1)]|nr:hydantoin utilization protein A [Chromatiales bacterium (ex Bugula neritina AB1)]
MNATTAQTLIGIDVGGTFTDVFAIDQRTGAVSVHKVASTRGSEADGFFEGITSAVAHFSTIAAIIHGTTVGTNALLERKGAETGLITTAGFRDILQMRRRDRPTTWGLRGQYDPVVSRAMSIEVPERTLADGSVLTRLNEEKFAQAVEQLLSAGIESIAVVFINAHANPANENRARQLLQDLWPNKHISLSSELLPEIREFERASTTALNAYLQPVVGNYLRTLDERLNENGFGGEFLIVQSSGGLMNAETAAQTPVRTALSGPAAGVYASAYLATQSGFNNVITCDMGGTSFDISVVADGMASLASQTSVDFGLVIRAPMIEITTIGAGGGSIAWIDPEGMIRIGPESAGSTPGPVCYGRGNDRPTVTDANVVLGRINSSQPIGGQLQSLDRDAARYAIEKHIARPLGMEVMAAAEAIIDVANALMAGAIRLVSIERGHDPRQFAAMPFGGGGALHTCALVREIGLASALVPRYPGIVSALGCVIADMRQDFVKTLNQPLSDTDPVELQSLIAAFSATGSRQLREAKAEFSEIEVHSSLDMLYIGQTHSVDVSLQAGATEKLTTASVLSAFEHRYKQVYGRLLDQAATAIINLRVTVVGRRPKFDPAVLAPDNNHTIEEAQRGRREVYFSGKTHQATVYNRLQLPVAATVTGPAVLEQPDTTIWVEPGFSGTIDKQGNLIVSRTK